MKNLNHKKKNSLDKKSRKEKLNEEKIVSGV